MNDIDDSMIEAFDEAMTQPTGAEAPQSIHVDAYYKGFHAGFTIRKEQNKSVAVSETTNLIDTLISQGWQASWNQETNKANGHTIVKVDPNAPVCEIHNKPMTLKPAGVSKLGKAYPAFWACSERMPDGSFCRFKPATNKI